MLRIGDARSVRFLDVTSVIDDLNRLEHEGLPLQPADASLELLMRRATGWQQDFYAWRARG